MLINLIHGVVEIDITFLILVTGIMCSLFPWVPVFAGLLEPNWDTMQEWEFTVDSEESSGDWWKMELRAEAVPQELASKWEQIVSPGFQDHNWSELILAPQSSQYPDGIIPAWDENVWDLMA